MERESENKVSSTVPLNVTFSAFLTRALSSYLSVVSSGPGWLSLFSADSLSRSVHCAPDENDRPSEQTITFKLTSVYVPVKFNELTKN